MTPPLFFLQSETTQRIVHFFTKFSATLLNQNCIWNCQQNLSLSKKTGLLIITYGCWPVKNLKNDFNSTFSSKYLEKFCKTKHTPKNPTPENGSILKTEMEPNLAFFNFFFAKSFSCFGNQIWSVFCETVISVLVKNTICCTGRTMAVREVISCQRSRSVTLLSEDPVILV